MIEKKFYGERLRSARMYRGLTLTELAKRTETVTVNFLI